MMPAVPHLRVVVGFCVVAVAGYGLFSLWAIYASQSEALQGDVGGTWKSFAVAAFAFWLGASSGGKARDAQVAPPVAEPAPAPAAPGKPVLDLTEEFVPTGEVK